MIKKQVVLGAGLMTAGAIMMAAMLKQPKEQTPVQSQDTVVKTTSNANVSTITPSQESASLTQDQLQADVQGISTPEVQPLTVDASTETQVLQDKEQQRQADSEQIESQNSQLMAQKHAAEDLAMQRQNGSQEEDEETVAANLQVQTRPESARLAQAELEQQKAKQAQKKAEETKKAEQLKKAQETKKAEELKAKKAEESKKAQEAKKAEELKAKKAQEAKRAEELKAQQDKSKQEKAKTTPKTYVVQAGDNLIRLSKEYNIPVSAIAEANNMGRHDPLQRGRTIKLPTAKEVKELQARAEKREQERLAKLAAKQKQEAINERLAQARREAKKQGINDNYAVQVALATDQAKADEVANAYKKAGYSKVRTVKEARGVRVIVGTERSKEAAIALKDKINNDSSVKSDGAWVISGK